MSGREKCNKDFLGAYKSKFQKKFVKWGLSSCVVSGRRVSIVDLEKMIASTPRYERVDSINIHDGSTYALKYPPYSSKPCSAELHPLSPRSFYMFLHCPQLSLMAFCGGGCVCVHVHACADVRAQLLQTRPDLFFLPQSHYLPSQSSAINSVIRLSANHDYLRESH